MQLLSPAPSLPTETQPRPDFLGLLSYLSNSSFLFPFKNDIRLHFTKVLSMLDQVTKYKETELSEYMCFSFMNGAH